MVGPVEAGEPPRDLRRVDPGVAGHDGAVRQPHDERRVVLAAVRVDDEPREGGEQRRRAKPLGEDAGERGDADIVGDVALELGGRQAEAGIFRRDAVARVVDEDEQAAVDVAVDRLVGIRPQECAGIDRCRHVHSPPKKKNGSRRAAGS